MRAPLYVQLFSLLLMSLGIWLFVQSPLGPKIELANPAPFGDWSLNVRNEDEEDIDRYGSAADDDAE